MSKNSLKGAILAGAFVLSGICYAQTPSDSDYFLKSGIDCYNKGMLDDAAIEFENVLLLNKMSFEAKVWLAQTYIDLKQLDKAGEILYEAALQAPDHPKVVQLREILGKNAAEIKAAEDSPSKKRLRPFGLVIPENKVKVNNPEIALLSLDTEPEIEPDEDKKINLKDYFKKKSGPLADVLELERTTGITAALDLYLSKILKDPSIGSQDDQGLLMRGNRIFSDRFSDNAFNPENRFYYGALLYINGSYADALETLEPMKASSGGYSEKLRPIMAALDKWKLMEDERIAQLKKAEAERRQLEELARLKEQNKKKDVWDELKRRRTGTDAKAAPSDGTVSEAALAAALHTQGYDLYKKGKLDEAIEKYNECLAKDDKNAECVYHLGLAWTDKALAGDISGFDRAVTYFEQAIRLDPNSKNAQEATSMIRDINSARQTMGE
ncbi:MAG: tetratricopeptide repeat protein [Candidatus Riflebacteria bacterium]|nr:tetratricopeptide repeat protein [Candidatus Riflebacteria bacterium]